jgi:hypothetical protein
MSTTTCGQIHRTFVCCQMWQNIRVRGTRRIIGAGFGSQINISYATKADKGIKMFQWFDDYCRECQTYAMTKHCIQCIASSLTV